MRETRQATVDTIYSPAAERVGTHARTPQFYQQSAGISTAPTVSTLVTLAATVPALETLAASQHAKLRASHT